MSKLHIPVTIHFKENSIPGLRRGVMTEESKQAIKDLMLEICKEVNEEIPHWGGNESELTVVAKFRKKIEAL